jgi:transposase
LYLKAIHGGKTKNDKIDANKIATLLRGGTLAQAHVYPKGMRETRDLLRRRAFLVRQRALLIAHIQNEASQYNLPEFAKKLTYAANREELDGWGDRACRAGALSCVRQRAAHASASPSQRCAVRTGPSSRRESYSSPRSSIAPLTRSTNSATGSKASWRRTSPRQSMTTERASPRPTSPP